MMPNPVATAIPSAVIPLVTFMGLEYARQSIINKGDCARTAPVRYHGIVLSAHSVRRSSKTRN